MHLQPIHRERIIPIRPDSPQSIALPIVKHKLIPPRPNAIRKIVREIARIRPPARRDRPIGGIFRNGLAFLPQFPRGFDAVIVRDEMQSEFVGAVRRRWSSGGRDLGRRRVGYFEGGAFAGGESSALGDEISRGSVGEGVFAFSGGTTDSVGASVDDGERVLMMRGGERRRRWVLLAWKATVPSMQRNVTYLALGETNDKGIARLPILDRIVIRRIAHDRGRRLLQRRFSSLRDFPRDFVRLVVQNDAYFNVETFFAGRRAALAVVRHKRSGRRDEFGIGADAAVHVGRAIGRLGRSGYRGVGGRQRAARSRGGIDDAEPAVGGAGVYEAVAGVAGVALTGGGVGNGGSSDEREDCRENAHDSVRSSICVVVLSTRSQIARRLLGARCRAGVVANETRSHARCFTLRSTLRGECTTTGSLHSEWHDGRTTRLFTKLALVIQRIPLSGGL